VKAVRLSAEADVELAETAGFYDERQVGLGAAFISEFVKASQLIERFPSSGRPIGNRMRRVLTNRFPYAIIYLDSRDEIGAMSAALAVQQVQLTTWGVFPGCLTIAHGTTIRASVACR
jgi:hypothetical protein